MRPIHLVPAGVVLLVLGGIAAGAGAVGTAPWTESATAPWTGPATAPRPEPEPEPWTNPASGYPPPRSEPVGERGPATAPVKRSRGGQHAARHGKPSRRWRGPARQGPSDDHQPPTMETVPADDEDLSPWVTPDPMTAGQHAPWESGDRP